MKCPQCKLVEMFVNKVDIEEKVVHWQCRKCGKTETTELIEDENEK